MTKFITLEGMSGTGKDVQRKRLEDALKAASVEVLSIVEPSPFLTEMIDAHRRSPERDHNVEFHLFTADRQHQLNTVVDPYVKENQENGRTGVVIQSRSWLSTLAYQGVMQDCGVERVIRENEFYPEFDLPLILLAKPEVALERILSRQKESGKKQSPDEQLQKLQRIHDAYLVAADEVSGAVIIDANGTEEEVYAQIKTEVRKNLGLLRRGIFLDKDRTFVSDDKYPAEIPTYEFFEEAEEGLRMLSDIPGVKLVASNAPWVGKGRLENSAQVEAIYVEVKRRIEALGGELHGYYYCEAQRGEGHPDKKPSPGMLLRGIREYHLDPSESWMVGDSGDDIKAGHAAGFRTIFVDRPGKKARYFDESDWDKVTHKTDSFTGAMRYLKEVAYEE